MSIDFLSEFRIREGEVDIRQARWYIIAASALTAAAAGEHVGELYRQVTTGLPLEDRKIVQRRIKEALLKASILCGVPRSAVAFSALYAILPEDEIDTYSPRTEKFNNPGDEQRRAERGRKYFDTLWGGPSGGQAQRDRASKYYPDVYLLNIKTNYELWMSEDAILSNIETQLCNVALLICNNSPTQMLWHLNGLLRHGATREEAQFAQDLALAVARQFNAKTGDITKIEDLKL
ncbi:uncharacterized protein Z519_02862 [Cladophialophora bantiana CBS 173.52]|uniref:Carboxymuconolactone decarboxylase-like domain-containing protein n=1 Tax=Cladophialophora bantiana (strain ATCC 10958 / CBS 173.52 / CDC B-1940 / NIH 8579) TaxID=1442370 RepID=A0A0D2HQS3_CLAB1|nr:uncharacterized protein Z519_02862 [Cladophialophora bantiana CBS 173.52]KIW95798.1 hypothetical protein Z519_02862 [Cladophialophora bantiana CBS 173.52]